MTPPERAQLQQVIEKWRRTAMRDHGRGNNLDHARDSQSYHYGSEHAYEACADELESLLSALIAEAPPQQERFATDDEAREAGERVVTTRRKLLERLAGLHLLPVDGYPQERLSYWAKTTRGGSPFSASDRRGADR